MNLVSVYHKTWFTDWMDWLIINGDNLECESDLIWSKLEKVANAGGEKNFFFIQKKKPKKLKKVEKWWVFQT